MRAVPQALVNRWSSGVLGSHQVHNCCVHTGDHEAMFVRTKLLLFQVWSKERHHFTPGAVCCETHLFQEQVNHYRKFFVFLFAA